MTARILAAIKINLRPFFGAIAGKAAASGPTTSDIPVPEFRSRRAAAAQVPAAETPATRLCAFRTSRGLRQRELGSAIGVSRGYISDIESGRSQPSRNFAMKLHAVYGVSADWLLFGEAAR